MTLEPETLVEAVAPPPRIERPAPALSSPAPAVQHPWLGLSYSTFSLSNPQLAATIVQASDSSHPLSYWDTGAHGWRVASGPYTVRVGNSSRSLAAAGSFVVP